MSVFHSLTDVKYGCHKSKVGLREKSKITTQDHWSDEPIHARIHLDRHRKTLLKKKSNQINESRLTLLTGLLRFDSQLPAYLVRSVYPLLLSLKSCKGAEILSVTDCLLQRGAALCALRGLLAHWRTAAWQQRDKEGDPTSLQRRGVGRYEAV